MRPYNVISIAKGGQRLKVICDFSRDQSPIGKQSDQETLLLGIRIDFKEILARENLASCVENPQATEIRQIIQQPKVFLRAQFLAASVMICSLGDCCSSVGNPKGSGGSLRSRHSVEHAGQNSGHEPLG